MPDLLLDSLDEDPAALGRAKERLYDILHASKPIFQGATYMHSNNTRKIPEDKLDELIDKISAVKPVKKIHIKGRSLLNRNSEGDYRFSHRTIQEFLLARQLLEEPVWEPAGSILVTDFMIRDVIRDIRSERTEEDEIQGWRMAGKDIP